MQSAKGAILPTPFLPLGFFAAGVGALGLASFALALAAWTPLAILHLVAVGSFATIAMGALYQFVPVVGMQPLRGAPIGFAHLGLAAIGTLLLVAGFASGEPRLIVSGGVAHIIGILLQGSILAATMRAGPPIITAHGAAVALVGFLAAAMLGVDIAMQIARGLEPTGIPQAHASVGIAGFFAVLIVAVTFRLLRMFERINLEGRAIRREVSVAVAAAVAAVVPRIGLILLTIAALLFGYDFLEVARRRNPAYQRETFLYASVSVIAGIVAAFAAVLGMMERAVILALWLFIGSAVVGYIQRIVPFIWWIRRSRREGTRNIPTLGEMNESRLGHVVLALWVAGGIWATLAPGAQGPGWIAVIAWLGLVAQLVRPFTLPAKGTT